MGWMAEVETIHAGWLFNSLCIWTAEFYSRRKEECEVKPLQGSFLVKELFTSTSEHLWLQRRGQELVLYVVCVDCGRCCRCCPGSGGVRCLWWEVIQHALHLVLHFIRPVNQVALQLPSLLHHPLLPFPEPRQHVQPFVDLIEGCAARGAAGRSRVLGPVRGGLARHIELKLLRA